MNTTDMQISHITRFCPNCFESENLGYACQAVINQKPFARWLPYKEAEANSQIFYSLYGEWKIKSRTKETILKAEPCVS